MAQTAKHLPTLQETWVRSLGREDPFLWLSNIPLYNMYHNFFILSSVDRYLGCFQVLKVKVKVAQLCPTLRSLMEYTVHGILQAKILEWVTIPFSRESSQPRDQTQVSYIAGGFFTG